MTIPCRLHGIIYPSISEASRQTGFHRRTISSAIEAGTEAGTEDRIGAKPKLRREHTCGLPVLWQGKIYPSIAKAARVTWCSEDAVLKGGERFNRHTFDKPKNLIREDQIKSSPQPSDAPVGASSESEAGS